MDRESGSSLTSILKKVHNTLPIYSVRIDLDWRAFGVLKQGVVIWFWIGPHCEYERLLSKL